MAQLAISGHSTRGREVIAWLEMLGGENRFQRRGDNEYRFYYIDKNDHIQNTCGALGYVLFDLEKFEEKFPYKVGDKVIYEHKLREITKIVWEERTNTIAYKLDDKLYCNVIDDLQPYKEEVYAYNVINCYHQDFGDKVRIRLGNDFEIKVEDNITYIVKKQPQYPKTYEECCQHLGCDDKLNVGELIPFQQLVNARNAYWKIAGKQMGLRKPWGPDWRNYEEQKYCIKTDKREITLSEAVTGNKILAFPTPEMRDAFYENFRELIEQCKELL